MCFIHVPRLISYSFKSLLLDGPEILKEVLKQDSHTNSLDVATTTLNVTNRHCSTLKDNLQR